MGVAVRAQDIGQCRGVLGVGFLPGDPVSFAVSSHGHWVDGVDIPAAGAQRRDQEPACCFDGHRNTVLNLVSVCGKQVQQFR